MKILDVTMVTDSKQFFPKEGTLVFLQDAYKEQLSNLAQSILGSLTYSSSTVYVLFGCVNSGSGSNYIISSGAVFYNGEIFSVDAVSLTVSGGNIPVANIVTSQYTVNADPVTFSDTTTANIHNIRKISLGSGASGSGISDYVNFVFVNIARREEVLTLANTIVFTPSANYHPATKKYVDDNIAPYVIKKGNATVGNVGVSGTVVDGGICSYYLVTLPSAFANTNYTVSGALVAISGGDEANAAVSWTIRTKTTTSFILICKKKDSNSGTTNLSFDYTAIL